MASILTSFLIYIPIFNVSEPVVNLIICAMFLFGVYNVSKCDFMRSFSVVCMRSNIRLCFLFFSSSNFVFVFLENRNGQSGYYPKLH